MADSTSNSVTIVNNSNDTILGGLLCHTIGVPVITGPGPMATVLQFTDVGAGDTIGPGTTEAASSLLADYWAAALQFESTDGYMFLLGALDTEPYKKCDTPQGGSTQFVIGEYNGTAYDVSINTFEGDGSSDGSCSAVLAPITSLQDNPVAEVLTEMLKAILEG